MKNTLVKEISFILSFSLILALAYNAISEKGIPIIRSQTKLNWENDLSISKLIDTNNIKKSDSVKLIPVSETNQNNVLKESNSNKINEVDNPTTANPKTETNIDTNKKQIEQQKVPLDSTRVEITAITIDQAYKIYQSGIALFIDARIEAEYKLGHIKGAINIPNTKFDQFKDRLNDIPKNKLIISYCDGAGCDLSIELAEKISKLGYTNVKIFYGGWIDWSNKKYDIE